jgi:phosphoribosylformylglycinamidine synthase
LAVALAEVVLTARGPFGLDADLPAPRGRGQAARLDALLFGEGPGRVVVTVAPRHEEDLRSACAAAGLAARRAGVVTAEPGRLRLRVGGRLVCDLGPERLRVWEEALPGWLA